MSDLILEIYHGGKFVKEPYFHYGGGTVHRFYDVDHEKLNYVEIMKFVDSLGYANVEKVQYRPYGASLEHSMFLIWNDVSVNNALKDFEKCNLLEFYLEHGDEDDKEDANLFQTPVLQMDCMDDLSVDNNHVSVENGSDDEVHMNVNDGNGLDDIDVNSADIGLFNVNVLADEDEEEEDSGRNAYDGTDSEGDDGEYVSECDSLANVEVMTDDEELLEVRRRCQLLRAGKWKELQKVKDIENGSANINVLDNGVEPDNVSDLGCTFEPDNEEGVPPELDGGIIVTTVDGEVRYNSVAASAYGIEEEAENPLKEWHSDNENSDNLNSPDTTSDEEDFLRLYENRKKKIKYPAFDPRTEPKMITFCKGMTFTCSKQMKDAVRNYAIAGGYDIYFHVNERLRLQARCRGCPWVMWGSYMGRKRTFQVKSFVDDHRCVRQLRVKLATSKWLAEQYQTKLTTTPFWRIKDFMEDVKSRYGIEVSHNKCFAARRQAMSEIQNSLNEHYARMFDYCKEIERSNPGSTVVLKTVQTTEGQRFQRLYICLDACKKGWITGCRPVIGLDGCFLKTFCKGELLTAIGRDGNNQMFPVAWAVVEVENKKSWSWFLRCLLHDVGMTDGFGWTLISDQQKGLVNAVKELLPNAEHRNCARHIYANLRKKYTGAKIRMHFWQAAKSTTKEDWKEAMGEIKKCSVDCFNTLMEMDPTVWSRAFFLTSSKCDSVDNNMCETFNGWILEARYKPVISMLEDIRKQVMVRMHKKRDEIMKRGQKYGKRVKDKLEENIVDVRHCQPTWNGNMAFEVIDPRGGFIVDLDRRTCSCRAWDLSGIPCCHAISSLYYMKYDIGDYVSDWLKCDMYLRAYGHMLEPMNGRKLWPRTNMPDVLPPTIRKMPGRPKKARMKEVNEETTTISHRLTKHGVEMKCSNCKKTGHNKRRCPIPQQVQPTTEPKRKKIPVRRSNATSTEATSVRATTIRPTNFRGVERVPSGFGAYVSTSTGNIYVNPVASTGARGRGRRATNRAIGRGGETLAAGGSGSTSPRNTISPLNPSFQKVGRTYITATALQASTKRSKHGNS